MKFLDLIRGTSNNAAAGLHREARIAAQKFDDDEIHVLKKTWEDLSERSNGKGIDRDTFLQYFPLNGLLGERLFAQFDMKKSGYIDFEEFITGLATVCRGTMDDKIHFVFNMYDVSHDNTVSKQELTTLLNHIPKEAFTEFHTLKQPPALLRNTSTGSVNYLPTGHSNNNLQAAGSEAASSGHVTSDSETTSLAGEHIGDASGINGEFEEIDAYTNQDIVETAFAECDLNHEGRLSYAEFKMWIERNPSIINYIETILPYNGPKDIAPHHSKAETLPHMKRIQSRVTVARSGTLQDVAGEIFNHSTNSIRRNSTARKPTMTINTDPNHPVVSVPMSPYGPPLSRNSSFASSNAPPPQYNLPGGTLTRGNSISPPPGQHTGMPVPPAVTDAASVLDPEELARMYLQYAYELTNNPEMKSAIQHILDQDMIAAPRIDSSEVYRTVVCMESYLWKKGKSMFHSWTKRYYLLSGNCMYYYLTPDDVRPKGVIFLTGCIIERLREEEMEMKGYYGLEVVHQDLCTGNSHPHDKRVLYCRTEAEREKWVTALQHAAHVVPIEDDYVIGKELGRGRFSVVCECVHKESGKHCAVKIIDKATIEPEEKSLLRTEIAVLKLVNHPNIIKLEGLYESKQNLYIVMEMLKGGELFERIVGRPRFTELEAARLLRPLLESVAYLHDLGIVHRDLKPENILCGDELEDLKIADFGLSKMILPKEKMDAACGTLSYVAPEVLTMQGYGKEADLWSVGVIMFLLLCGKLPFDGEDHNEIIRSTIQADLKVNPNVWNKLTEDAKQLITSLLNKNPKDRITARESLKHPFLLNTLGLSRRQSLASLEHKENGNGSGSGLHSPTHHGGQGGAQGGAGHYNGASNHYPGFSTPPVTPSQPITPTTSIDSHGNGNHHHGVTGVSPSNATLSLAEAGLDMFK